MSTGVRYFYEEISFPQGEESYSREGFTISISPLKRQIETPFSSQENSRI